MLVTLKLVLRFFFNDTATTEIYTLSLHDALPISVEVPLPDPPALRGPGEPVPVAAGDDVLLASSGGPQAHVLGRSEEHTSELQSRQYLVCRLLLEKKKL